MKVNKFLVVLGMLILMSMLVSGFDPSDPDIDFLIKCENASNLGQDTVGKNNFTVNSVTQSNDKPRSSGKSCYFAGSGGNNLNLASFQLDSTYTVGYWFRTNSSGSQEAGLMMANAALSSRKIFHFTTNFGSSPAMQGFNAPANLCTILTNTNLSTSDDTWHHLVFMVNGTTITKMFVDGVQRAADGAPGCSGTDNLIFRIGEGTSGAQSYNGLETETFLIDRALTDTEIQDIYNIGFALANFTITAETYNGSQLTNFTATVNYTSGGLPFSEVISTTTGSAVTSLTGSSIGKVNVTINASGPETSISRTYFNESTLTGLFTFDYAIINVSAYDVSNGTQVQQFNARFERDDDTLSFNVNDFSKLYFGNSDTYNITIDGDDFAAESNIFTVSNAYLGINQSLLPDKSVNITIRDITSENLILQNVEIRLTSNTSSTDYNTSTGSLFVDGLEPNIYTIRIESSGFEILVDQLLIQENVSLDSTYYLINSSNPNFEFIVFNVKDLTLEPLSNVLVRVRVNVNGTITQISQRLTDNNGQVGFGLDTSESHFFDFSKTGFTSQIDVQYDLIESTYDVILRNASTLVTENAFLGINYYWLPTEPELIVNELHNFTWFVESGDDSEIESFRIELNLSNGTIFSNASSNDGGTLTLTDLNFSEVENETVTAFYCYTKEGFSQVCFQVGYNVRIDTSGASNFLEMKDYINANVPIMQRIVLWIAITFSIVIVLMVVPFFRSIFSVVPIGVFGIFFAWLLLPAAMMIVIVMFVFVAGALVLASSGGRI